MSVYKTNFPAHEGLINFPPHNFPEDMDAARPNLNPAILVEDPKAPLHVQRALGVTVFGGVALFNPRSPLTDKETQVTALVMSGLDNRAVGRVLYINNSTVKTHLGHASAKIPVPKGAASGRAGFMYRMASISVPEEPLLYVVRPPIIDILSLLSDRELEISRGVARGLENSSIAAGLKTEAGTPLSVSTLKSHLTNMGKKLGTGERTLLGEVVLMTDTASEQGREILRG